MDSDKTLRELALSDIPYDEFALEKIPMGLDYGEIPSCRRCGALVLDFVRHSEWHRKNALPTRFR